MKRTTAFFFIVLYLGFLAGTVLDAGSDALTSSKKIWKKSGEDRLSSNKESANYWNAYATHLSKAIKHFGAVGKSKLPRAKSNFFTTADLSLGNKICYASQSVSPLTDVASTAPLYIKNRVLRI